VIALVRVDNRLIHGQVVEAWLPQLKVSRVAVADDEAAQSPLIRAAMGLAVQSSIDVLIQPLKDVAYPLLSTDPKRTLVLLRDVAGVVDAHARGLAMQQLNLGNVHFATGRKQVSPSVFLSKSELEELQALARAGVDVEARGVPSDRPVSLAEMVQRFEHTA
jgi:mannose/fructose/N-acetylgalactosamine-specific phosphotransferase system component IIB